MPYVLGMVGFEAGNSTRDFLVNLANTPTYTTLVLPTNSESARAAGANGWQFRAPWHDHVNSTQFVPTGDELWIHAQYYTNTNSGANDGLRIGIGNTGTEYISVSAEDTTNKITIRVAGNVRATASVAAFSLGTWARLHIHIGGNQTGDIIRVYLNGDLSTPVVSYTLIAADQTNLGTVGTPNEFLCTCKAGSNEWLDDLIAFDAQHVDFTNIAFFGEASIKPQIFNVTRAGADWSGSHADIDEIPASDTDKITAAAVDDVIALGKAAIGSDNVYAYKVMARITRTGTDAGSNLTIKLVEGVDETTALVPAPTDGDKFWIATDAADGNPLSAAAWDASDIHFVATT